jgi:hypothetical protein
MKKLLALSIILVLILSGCGKNEKIEKQASLSDPTEDSYKILAESQIKIENLRKQENVNWKEIRSAYMRNIDLVRFFDKEFGTGYENEIAKAFENCENGIEPKVNQQVFAKGLQHINAWTIFKESALMMKSGDKNIHVQRIKKLFEGIRPTFTRRDKDFFGSVSTLEKAADEALSNLPGMGAALELEKAILRTYAYSLIYEIIEIEKLRESKPEECKVKLKEGEYFYRIIRDKIAKSDPAADEFIQNMLRSSFANMSYEAVKEKISGIIIL